MPAISDMLLALPAVACLIIVACLLARGRRPGRAGRYVLVGLGALLLFVTAHAAITRPDDNDKGERLAVLMWTDGDILRRLADRWGDDGRPTTIVGSAAARDLCARHFPRARSEAIDDDDEEGVVVESALRFVTANLDRVRDGGEVVLVAPRTRDLATARELSASLLGQLPRLRDALHILSPEDVGSAWPRLTLRAPLTITPDTATFPVSLSADHVPGGCQVYLTCWGRRVGRPKDAEIEAVPVGVVNGRLQLTPGAAPVGFTVPPEGLRGTLPAPEPDPECGRTLVLTARLVNEHKETLAFQRVSVTAEVQPLGLIQTASSPAETSLKELLKGLGLEWRPVKLTGNVEQDVRTFKKWRLLVLEDQLGPADSAALVAVLLRLDPRPALLFVGPAAPRSALAGNKTLLSAPLPTGEARKVVFVCDLSGSMSVPVEGRSLPRWQLAQKGSDKLRPGLKNRDVNHLIATYKDLDRRKRVGLGPDPQFDPAKWVCPLSHFAGDPDPAVGNRERNRDDWELCDHLLFAVDLAKRDPRVSDVVFIYDPADTYQGRALPEPSRKAAAKLVKMGVRMHLVAAGRQEDGADPGNLGPDAFASVVATSDWVIRDRKTGQRQPAGTDDDMVPLLQKYIFEEALPCLKVGAAEEGRLRELLTGPGVPALRAYVERPDSEVRLLNALAPFKPRGPAGTAGAWEPAVADRVALWVKHWQHPAAVAPLLLRDEIVLAPGKASVAAYHLALDLDAENAATSDESAAETTPARNALAGLLVRVLSAVSGQWVAPTIHFAPREDGFVFFRADFQPLTIRPALEPDPKTYRGVGLGCLTRTGLGPWRPAPARPDTRDLSTPWLAPRGLPAHEAKMVRLVVEDADETVGRLAIDLPLTAAPPWPVTQRADQEQIAAPPPAGAAGDGPAAGWGLTPRALAVALVAAWAALALYAWRGL
jgi:hypothetical protein